MARKQKSAAAPIDSLVINAATEMVDVEKLRPHPRNPRHGDIGALVELIKANGFYGHCIVQRSTGYILAGNHRYKAGVACGMKQVPVVWLDVDDARALKILVSDNRASDLASNDDAKLLELLKDSIGDLSGTGYDGDALDDLIADSKESESKGDRENSDGDGEKNPVIQYAIVFDDAAQQQRWYDFLAGLKRRYPEAETIALRLDQFIAELPE